MFAGLVAGSVLMLLDLLATLLWRLMGRLRHWPYALTHCFLWPLVTWSILALFYQQQEVCGRQTAAAQLGMCKGSTQCGAQPCALE